MQAEFSLIPKASYNRRLLTSLSQALMYIQYEHISVDVRHSQPLQNVHSLQSNKVLRGVEAGHEWSLSSSWTELMLFLFFCLHIKLVKFVHSQAATGCRQIPAQLGLNKSGWAITFSSASCQIISWHDDISTTKKQATTTRRASEQRPHSRIKRQQKDQLHTQTQQRENRASEPDPLQHRQKHISSNIHIQPR